MSNISSENFLFEIPSTPTQRGMADKKYSVSIRKTNEC